MDLAIEKTITDYFEETRKKLTELENFKLFSTLVNKQNLTIDISLLKDEHWRIVYYFLSVNVLDSRGEVFFVPEDSPFFDDIGSLGGCECIMLLNKRKKTIKKFSITEELLDDILLSIDYLKSLP